MYKIVFKLLKGEIGASPTKTLSVSYSQVDDWAGKSGGTY
jgi:hypothetical protein